MYDDFLKEIGQSIKKAKHHTDLAEKYTKKVFDLLYEKGIEAECIETNAENASNLEEAIHCYIQYGEYSVNGLIREIKKAIDDEADDE